MSPDDDDEDKESDSLATDEVTGIFEDCTEEDVDSDIGDWVIATAEMEFEAKADNGPRDKDASFDVPDATEEVEMATDEEEEVEERAARSVPIETDVMSDTVSMVLEVSSAFNPSLAN